MFFVYPPSHPGVTRLTIGFIFHLYTTSKIKNLASSLAHHCLLVLNCSLHTTPYPSYHCADTNSYQLRACLQGHRAVTWMEAQRKIEILARTKWCAQPRAQNIMHMPERENTRYLVLVKYYHHLVEGKNKRI